MTEKDLKYYGLDQLATHADHLNSLDTPNPSATAKYEIMSGALIWRAGQSVVIPYVVEVDRLGEVQAVAPAITPYQPSDAQIAWYLGRFITDVRSLSTDPVLVRRNWLEA